MYIGYAYISLQVQTAEYRRRKVPTW